MHGRLIIAILLLPGFAALGCSNDLDALFRAPDMDAGTQARTLRTIPRLPALPDVDRRNACADCAERTCDQARANCLEDDDCTDELVCKGRCRDPACLQACTAAHGSSPWYADYANCVFGQCPTECNTGNNWECQQEYDWPAAEEPAFGVKFDFTASPTFFLGSQVPTYVVGALVSACDDAPDCSAPQDSAKVGIDNTVTLVLRPSALPPKDFRGYLSIVGGDVEEHQILYLAPLARPQEFFAGFVSSGTVSLPMIDMARPRVSVVVTDCLVAPVRGARVTLPELPDVTGYTLEGAGFRFTKGPTTATGVAVLYNLPDSVSGTKVRVRAERSSGERVPEREVLVQAGFSTGLWLGPAARSEPAN
jgi:hypothetical protein